jgi:hypothetical protein
MTGLFSDFPRKIGVPEQLMVDSEKRMMDIVNAANGHMNIYVALFSENQRLFGNLDKVCFDFDDCDSACDDCKDEKKRKCSIGALDVKPKTFNTFQNMMALHRHYQQSNKQHSIGFSGGGYHLYVKVVPIPLRHPNPSLKKYAAEVTKELQIKTDCSVFEIFRIMRFPGTFNISKQKWFTWLTPEDLEKGDEWIREKANTQHIGSPYVWPGAGLDLRPFDNNNVNDVSSLQRQIDVEGVGQKIENITLLPCIRAMLADPYANFRTRYLEILFLKEKGLSLKDTVKVLQDHLSKDKFNHCILEERQPAHIYRNSKLLFPRCKTLAQDGYCVEPNCPMKDSIYI